MTIETTTNTGPPDQVGFWPILARSLAVNPVEPPTPAQIPVTADSHQARTGGSRLRSRIVSWCSDAMLTIAWIVVFLKLFVIDIDRALLNALWPSAAWLLDFRSFLLLLVICIVAVCFWRWRAAFYIAYAMFFPILMIIWKLPNLVVRLRLYRRWVFWMLLFNGLSVFCRNLRFFLISMSLTTIAVLVIILAERPAFLIMAAAVLPFLLGWAYWRAIREAFSPSWFLKSQKKILDFISSFTFKPAMEWGHKAESRRDGVFDSKEIQDCVRSIGIGIVANRALYMWAYQLQRYRESSLTLLFNLAAYIWLFVGSVFTFTLLNIAVLKIDPSQFRFNAHPSIIAMMLYSQSSLFRNEGGGVSANGDVAFLLQAMAGFCGPVLLAVVLSNVLLSFRRTREDKELKRTVSELRVLARSQEVEFKTVLMVGFDDACDRFLQLGLGGWVAAVDYVRKNVPREFFQEEVVFVNPEWPSLITGNGPPW